MAVHRATVSSEVGDVYLQTVGSFSGTTNFIDILGRNGVELASSGGGVALQAFAVVDINGGLVEVNALDTIRLTAAEQNVLVTSSQFVDLSTQDQVDMDVVGNVLFQTTGDSESHIVLKYVRRGGVGCLLLRLWKLV